MTRFLLQASTFIDMVALTYGTSHTSIFTMTHWTEIISSNSLAGYPRTVNKPSLRSTACQVIQEDGTSAMAKEGIGICDGTCGYELIQPALI